jgi:hypothetical protein
MGLYYDQLTSETLTGAWGARRLISTYTGPILRVLRVYTGVGGGPADIEIDYYANDDGELNVPLTPENYDYFVMRLYDQTGGDDLIQNTNANRPKLFWNVTPTGKAAIKFDGSNDFMKGETDGTTRPYMTARPFLAVVCGGNTTNETYATIAKIVQQSGSNPSPYTRFGVNLGGSGFPRLEAKVDATAAGIDPTMTGLNSSGQGWTGFLMSANNVFATPGLRENQPLPSARDVTYPSSTALYVGGNGAGDENAGLYYTEIVMGQSATLNFATASTIINKVVCEQAWGANRAFRLVVSDDFGAAAAECSFAEVQGYYTIGGTNVFAAANGGRAFANRRVSTTEDEHKAIDGNNSTQYSAGPDSSPWPVWGVYAASSGELAQLVIRARGDNFATTTIKVFTVEELQPDGTWAVLGSFDLTSQGVSLGQVYTLTLPLNVDFSFNYEIATEEPVPISADFDFDYTYVYQTYEFTVTVPAGEVLSNLTAFPVYLRLQDIPSAAWPYLDELAGNLRVFNAGGTELPIDVLGVNKNEETGECFYKSDLLSASDNVFTFRIYNGISKYDPTATNGRNAVWADYDGVYVFNELVDRTGNGRNAALLGSSSAYNYDVSAVGPDINVHQGLAYDGTHYYAIDTLDIQKYTTSWVAVGSPFLLSSIGTPDVNHFGDGTIYDGNLYVVYETYPNSPYDNQHVAVIDPATMTLVTTYDISAQGHEVSSICYDPINDWFVITDFTPAGVNKLHKYDTSFNYLGFITTPNIEKKQGIEYYNNHYWITCDSQVLYKLTLNGVTRTLEWQGDIPGFMEGIAHIGSGNFIILFDNSSGLSAAYTFSPSDGITGLPGWLNLNGAGYARADGFPYRTTWTMGASNVPNNVSSNGAILSYTPIDTSNNFRASLVLRGSVSQYGIWNSTDTWLMATGSAPAIGTRRRLHHTQSGTTNRKIWVNGVLSATDTGCAQRPATKSAAVPSLYIGAEDETVGEVIFGSINYVYLRNGELSANWLLAESSNIENPTGFYTVSETTAPPIDEDFSFDYAIQLGKSASFDYAYNIATQFSFDFVIQLGQSFSFDYASALAATFGFDYALDLGRSFDFDYGYSIAQSFTFDSAIDLGRSYTFEYILNDVLRADFAFDYAVDLGSSFTFDYAYQITADFTFDYKYAVAAIFSSDYAIQLGAAFSFDYQYVITADFDFDYGYQLGKAFSFSYAVQLGTDFDFDYGFGFSVDYSFDYRIATVEVATNFTFSYLINSVPLSGFTLVPETPITERWEYLTSVAVSRDGSEQRSALRREPRLSLDYTYTVTTEAERRLMFDFLHTQMKGVFLVPLYAYGVQITAPVLSGGVNLAYNDERTDIRSGDFVYYMTPDGETGAFEIAQIVGTNSLQFAFGAAFDLPAGSWVMPALEMTADTGAGLNMRALGGSVSVSLQAVENRRALVRPAASDTLTAFDGFPVLDQRHLAEEGITDAFDGGLISLDDAADVRRAIFSPYAGTFVGGVRSYRIDRNGPLMDRWRGLADAMKGKRSPFLISTYRQDLEPGVNSPGTTLDIIGRAYLNKFDQNAFKRIEIEAGGVVSRHVVTGVAEIAGGLRLTLDTGYASANISRVSFLVLVRLNGDVITVTHEQLKTKFNISVRSVDA